jgi:hypothetical protein
MKGYIPNDQVIFKISQQLKEVKTIVYQKAMKILKLLVDHCIPLKLEAERELKHTIRIKNKQYEVVKIILEINNKLIPWYKNKYLNYLYLID